MQEIKKIILDKKYDVIDKIILIYKYIDNGKDLKSLAEVLDISPELLMSWEPVKIKKEKQVPKKSLTKDFIIEFQEMYKSIRGHTFKMSKKEAGQIINIINLLYPEIYKWSKILELIKTRAISHSNNPRYTNGTWKWIVENITPTRIQQNLNFILGELTNKQTKDIKSEKAVSDQDREIAERKKKVEEFQKKKKTLGLSAAVFGKGKKIDNEK